MRKMVSIFVPLAFVVALVVAYTQNAESQRGTPRDLPQPSTWVEFEADMVKTAPRLGQLTCRFRRNDDGSTRSESFLPEALPEKVTVIGIVNHTKGMAYAFRSDRGVWNTWALGMTPKRVRPRRFTDQTKGLSKASEKREGLDVYNYVLPNGNTKLLAPALNFFEVVTQELSSGIRQELSNIQIRPQPDELFEPPANAVLKMEGPSVEDKIKEQHAKQGHK